MAANRRQTNTCSIGDSIAAGCCHCVANQSASCGQSREGGQNSINPPAEWILQPSNASTQSRHCVEAGAAAAIRLLARLIVFVSGRKTREKLITCALGSAGQNDLPVDSLLAGDLVCRSSEAPTKCCSSQRRRELSYRLACLSLHNFRLFSRQEKQERIVRELTPGSLYLIQVFAAKVVELISAGSFRALPIIIITTICFEPARHGSLSVSDSETRRLPDLRVARCLTTPTGQRRRR